MRVARLTTTVTLALTCAAARDARPAVVVEQVSAGFAAARAGLVPGDVLLSWQSNAATTGAQDGGFDNPFQAVDVELEQAQRAETTIVVLRGGERVCLTIPTGQWELRTRPELAEGRLSRYRQALDMAAAGDVEAAVGLLERLAADAAGHDDEVWFLARAAEVAQRSDRPDLARRLLAQALAAATVLAPAQAAVIRQLEAAFLTGLSEYDAATAAHQQALKLRQGAWPGTLACSETVDLLALIAADQGAVDTADELFRVSLAIRRRLAPGSLAVAWSLSGGLGRIAWMRGERDALRRLNLAALAIQEALAPGGLEVARTLSRLGVLADETGDLARAEELGRRSLAIKQSLVPDSLDVAASLNNLSLVAWDRGDLATAQDLALQALAIRERLAPVGLLITTSLNNLGNIAMDRGDIVAAEDYARRALAIQEKLAPGSLTMATSLFNLGAVIKDRGDLAGAEELFRRSLAIRERDAPDSDDVADSLHQIGTTLWERGSREEAVQTLQRALALYEKAEPKGFSVSACLQDLGNYAVELGDLETADRHYQRALRIRLTLAPGSRWEAETANRLGILCRLRSRPQEALAYFRQAVEAIESQSGRLGGTIDTRTNFRATYHNYYRAYVELLLELGEAETAFNVVERSRAQGLLAMLAERDLTFTADLPPELDRARRLVGVEHDREMARLATLSPGPDDAEIAETLARLEKLHGTLQEVRAEISRHSPQLAALTSPRTLDLDGARKAVDPGTAVLSYFVGESQTSLFVLGVDRSLRVVSLPVGERRLRSLVTQFRHLLQRPESAGAETGAALRTRAAELYRLLVAPAEEEVAAAKRLLVVPSGPLQLLPFAALVRPGVESADGARDGHYLVEWKPLHSVESLTVFAELKGRRRASTATGSPTMVAFGDPLYRDSRARAASPTEPVARSPLGQGVDLELLPSTRLELASIAAVFGNAAQVYSGPEATEERAKHVAAATRYLHFATHAVLDEELPLDSALAFSTPQQPTETADDGLLQAWEIFESVRVDADLVTLSACETALGKELAGEGLVGLTRAFRFAGARTILGSLWSVADQTTAALMGRFYRHLAAGSSKDEALRAAQVELIRGPITVVDDDGATVETDASHPFYWAAFTLSGDWR